MKHGNEEQNIQKEEWKYTYDKKGNLIYATSGCYIESDRSNWERFIEWMVHSLGRIFWITIAATVVFFTDMLLKCMSS